MAYLFTGLPRYWNFAQKGGKYHRHKPQPVSSSLAIMINILLIKISFPSLIVCYIFYFLLGMGTHNCCRQKRSLFVLFFHEQFVWVFSPTLLDFWVSPRHRPYLRFWDWKESPYSSYNTHNSFGNNFRTSFVQQK